LDGDTLFELAVGALAEVDDAHAAAPDLVQHAEGAESFTFEAASRPIGPATPVGRGPVEEGGCGTVGGEQRFDIGAQRGIVRALDVEKACCVLRLEVESALEDRFDALPASRGLA